MHPFMNIASGVALRAGTNLLRSLERIQSVEQDKEEHKRTVMQVMHNICKEMISAIEKAYPQHSIISPYAVEERSEEFVWLIEPCDGFHDYVCGLPDYAVSIALQQNSHIEHSLVYLPATNELFSASRGHGTQVNAKRCRVTSTPTPTNALIAQNVNSRSPALQDLYISDLQKLMQINANYRYYSSSAVALAYVAAGRLDGVVAYNLKDTSAAGITLVKEAGGIVTDFSGYIPFSHNNNIIAANPKIYKSLIAMLTPPAEVVNEVSTPVTEETIEVNSNEDATA